MSNKSYFEAIDRIRQITGNRTSNSFLTQLNGFDVFRNKNNNHSIFLVYDFESNKQILKSKSFEPYNFIDGALKFNKLDFPLQKKFINNTPLFIENIKSHFQKTSKLRVIYQRFSKRIEDIQMIDLFQVIDNIFLADEITTKFLSKSLVIYFVQEIFEELTGKKLQLNPEYIEELSFISTTPTPRLLKNTESNLNRINSLYNTDSLSDYEYTALNSFLIMGFYPIVSSITVLLNNYIQLLDQKHSKDRINTFLKDFSFSNVTPINFLVRIAKKDITIEDINFSEGNIVYVFLGKLSKCPFNKNSSMPFGIGKHQCTGKQTAKVILDKTKDLLINSESKILDNKYKIRLSKNRENKADVNLLFD